MAGIIYSLVGPDPLFDHQYVHVREPHEDAAQHLHGDSTIDLRMHFDMQLMYFPHDVPLEMGGTLLVPGSHFRRINEIDIARYQNIVGQIPMVCQAGTILVLHHGIWHCGRQNKSDQRRYMFKVRLNPTVRQLRLWNTDDLDDSVGQQRPIFSERDAHRRYPGHPEQLGALVRGGQRPAGDSQPHQVLAVFDRRRQFRRALLADAAGE